MLIYEYCFFTTYLYHLFTILQIIYTPPKYISINIELYFEVRNIDSFYFKKDMKDMEFIIAGIISIGLLIYLVYVIFNPDKLK